MHIQGVFLIVRGVNLLELLRITKFDHEKDDGVFKNCKGDEYYADNNPETDRSNSTRLWNGGFNSIVHVNHHQK